MPLATGHRLGPFEILVPLGAGGMGAQWHLWSADVATGRERLVADLDLPASVMGLARFSLHPDGTRFATSLGLWPSDIWMIEGFDRR